MRGRIVPTIIDMHVTGSPSARPDSVRALLTGGTRVGVTSVGRSARAAPRSVGVTASGSRCLTPACGS